MDLVELVIGRRPARARQGVLFIETAPINVTWVRVRPRAEAPAVCAHIAEKSGALPTARGAQRYRARQHYIVEYGGGDKSVVRRDLFDRLYVGIGDGRFQKRPDLTFRYFVLDQDATILTPEGPERALVGDWIMEGLEGELYPMRPERGAALYEPI